jgi:hypothetical protein
MYLVTTMIRDGIHISHGLSDTIRNNWLVASLNPTVATQINPLKIEAVMSNLNR